MLVEDKEKWLVIRRQAIDDKDEDPSCTHGRRSAAIGGKTHGRD